MSNHAFEITPKRKDVLELDHGKGALEIVVSNRLGRAVSAHARLEPVGDTRAEWLALARPERDFAADGTQTFHAQIHVPRGAPVGRYKFRMIVGAHTDTPDEDRAASEPLVVQYSGHPQRPWYLILAALAGVVLLGLGIYGLYAWLSDDGNGHGGEAAEEVAEAVCVNEIVRSVWDPATRECVCPAGTQVTDIGDGNKKCVCPEGKRWDADALECVAHSCEYARAIYDDASDKCQCPEGTAARTVDGDKRCLCPVGLRFDAGGRTCQFAPCPTNQFFSDAAGKCACVRGLAVGGKCTCTLATINDRLVPVGVSSTDNATCSCPRFTPNFDRYTQQCTRGRIQRLPRPELEKLKDLPLRRDIINRRDIIDINP